MAALDKYIYDEAFDFDPDDVSHCIRKVQLQIYDENASNYSSGRVTFSTDQIANSGYWIDYSNAYLTVPFQITAVHDRENISAVMNEYVCGLKSNTVNLIDNLQIDYSGVKVQNQTTLQNVHANYKILTSQSLNKIQKDGMVSLISPDTATFSYTNGIGVNGNGLTNNQPLPSYKSYELTIPASYDIDIYQNTGYLQRLLYTGYYAEGTSRNLPTITTNDAAKSIAMPFYATSGAEGVNRIYTWSIMAIIRLADISDFVKNLPITRGAVMRLTLNFNGVRSQVINVINVPADPPTGPDPEADPPVVGNNYQGTPSLSVMSTTAGTTSLLSNTNPIMISSAVYGQPSSNILTGELTLRAGIGNSVTNYVAANQTGYQNCRIVAMGYVLAPAFENMLKEKREKRVIYHDILSCNLNASSGGGQQSQTMFNSVVNPKYVLIAPFLAASANGNMGLVEYQSPFNSAPSTCCPYGALRDFQIQVSGQNMFMSAELYDFEQFLDEFRSINALYGDGDEKMTSGVIDINNWASAYRYYVCDVSRRLPPDDKIPKNIQLLYSNPTSVPMQLICFVAYQREVTIDLFTGLITHSRL